MATTITFMLMMLFTLALASMAGAAGPPTGVAGDGSRDDTAAIQRALDEAGKTGGKVELPPGQYRIDGTLSIPTGVVLQGSWEEPHHGAWQKGSTLLVRGGRGQEDGPAAIELQQSSAIKGFTFVWPDQKWDDIVPYPWAIHGRNMHNTIDNVTFVNAYQGIKIGQPFSELHLIRNVFGCVLRRGIFIDTTSDVGRIENVHFNPHYWQRSGHPSITLDGKDHTGAIARYMQEHLEAFIFGRTDWEYVLNTFVFAAKVGYRFIATPAGACNGQFHGIGGDDCRACVQIDQVQDIGIQVTNGEFTAFAGEPNTAIVTSPGAGGAAQFMNCNFWGITGHAAWLQGNTTVTLANCHFVEVPAAGAILAERGRLIVQGCNFARRGPAILLKPAVRAAVIMGNLQPGGLAIENGIGARAQVGLNQTAVQLSAEELRHYRLEMGVNGDEDYLDAGWHGREAGLDGPPGSTGARWSMGKAILRLPVQPGTDYKLVLFGKVDPHATGFTAALPDGTSVPLNQPGLHPVILSIPRTLTAGKDTIEVTLSGPPWSPHRVNPADGDTRELGIRLFRVEMTAAGADSIPVTEAN